MTIVLGLTRSSPEDLSVSEALLLTQYRLSPPSFNQSDILLY